MLKRITRPVVRSALSRVLKSRTVRNNFTRELRDQGIYLVKRMDDHSMMVDPMDLIGRHVIKNGEYTRQAARDTIRFLEGAEALKRGGTLVEIGANIGTHAVYLRLDHAFDRSVHFEPHPHNLWFLKGNLAQNGFTDAEAHGIGIADKADELMLSANPHNYGASTFVDVRADDAEGRLSRLANGEQVKAPVVRFDEWCAGRLDPEDISLVWMDVEGFELQALRGFGQILSHRPPIFLEYSPYVLTAEQRDEFAALLAPYRKLMTYRGGTFHEVESLQAIGDQCDLLAY